SGRWRGGRPAGRPAPAGTPGCRPRPLLSLSVSRQRVAGLRIDLGEALAPGETRRDTVGQGEVGPGVRVEDSDLSRVLAQRTDLVRDGARIHDLMGDLLVVDDRGRELVVATGDHEAAARGDVLGQPCTVLDRPRPGGLHG